ncbi:MAG TPA: cytochrome c biogenesis protein ResB [Verrucomicrobiae bacterium]|nr:cytochrome c biogenesis protein ResB [Verrucomicrobiae bacterium]
MLDRLVRFFTSLKLTVVLLAFGLALVFFGTLAQVDEGLYAAQNRWFRSFVVLNAHVGKFYLPVFPGGYLLGGLLIINLLAAHTKYYRPEKRKIGIAMIHLGVVLLLVGQLLTDLLSTESSMHIREGSSANYSEAGRRFELAVIDTTDADTDKVVAIPEHRLLKRRDIAHPELPFTVRVQKFFINSSLSKESGEGYQPVKTTAGGGRGLWWREMPHETAMDRGDTPSGIIELTTPQGSLGTYLVSAFLHPQEFTHNGRQFKLDLRPQRFYKPFSLHLVEFRFDRYAGTEIPKNFSSRVRLQRPDTGEDREVLIYMNSPLRYAGETFYQADWDKADEKGTILQVVHNPSWLTPYFACVMVAAGLIFQFLTHLIGFARKWRPA